MSPCYQKCTLRDIQKINTGQLRNLNQTREDLEHLCYHEPAQRQEIMAKLHIINDKLRDKLARARQPIYCIENGCDICHPDHEVPFE